MGLVNVYFIDDSTGEAFATTEMRPEDLPETFDMDTTMHIGEEDWSVVEANPPTRAEFAEAGNLVLRIRLVEKIATKDIQFSLPSIADPIPVVGNEPLCGNEFTLAEDDWRQLEFVSADLRSTADAEIEKIRLIHQEAFTGVGWSEIHVRSQMGSPVSDQLELSELQSTLNATQLLGVSYHGAAAQIAGGYAFRKGQMMIYGTSRDGLVQSIALNPFEVDSPNPELVEQLKKLAIKWNLDLAWWCRCVRVSVEDPLFASIVNYDVD